MVSSDKPELFLKSLKLFFRIHDIIEPKELNIRLESFPELIYSDEVQSECRLYEGCADVYEGHEARIEEKSLMNVMLSI